MREQIATNIPQRASRPVTQDYEVEEDDSYYPQRMPTSARRYNTTNGERVYQRGNRRIVIHDEPPPKKRNHWMLYFGIGMIAMLALWIGLQMLSNWWSEHQVDTTYGYPRTYQVDEVVGHGDSTNHPTHFIFLNLKGRVVIIELPGGNIVHARIYNGPAIIGDSPDLIPVTADFQDINGDGKVDMLVKVGSQQFTYLNDGSQFKPQS
jgi:hypothetical protein